jgi:hypothetical protein
MVWDVTLPAGSEKKSKGALRIRELKTDLLTLLRGNTTDGLEAKFPGSDSAQPIFRYRGLKGTSGEKPTAGQYGLYFNTTKNTLERDNGSSWDVIGTVIPAGTVTVFYQANAPAGWTAQSVNDKFLRVVNSGGTGGTTGGGPVAASTSLAHTHTLDSHDHTIATQTARDTANAGGVSFPVITTTHNHGGLTGETTAETDSKLGAFAYADVVIASKD